MTVRILGEKGHICKKDLDLPTGRKKMRFSERQRKLIEAEMGRIDVIEKKPSWRRKSSARRSQICGISCETVEKKTVSPENGKTDYVFVVYVTWRDETVNVIYRSYQEFARLQRAVLKAIKGLKEDRRTHCLPTLPPAARLHTRVLELRDKEKEKTAIERVQVIDEYCKCVISLPRSIQDAAQVSTFFKPTETDIDFTAKPVEKSSSATLTRPGVTTAPAMSGDVFTVTHDFTPEASDQVKLSEGSSVSVMVKKDSGWWLVKTDEDQGWVPATHLESQTMSREEQVIKYPKGMEEKFMVVKGYTSDLTDEISIPMGSVVEVVEKTMDGWWLIRCKGKEGRAPATNLRRANTAKAQHMLEISSQATLEAQMQRSKSPLTRKSSKSKKDKSSGKKEIMTLPDVIPTEVEEIDVLPPPPRREVKRRHGAFRKLIKSTEIRKSAEIQRKTSVTSKKSSELSRRTSERAKSVENSGQSHEKRLSRQSSTSKSPRESPEKKSTRDGGLRRQDSRNKSSRDGGDKKSPRQGSGKRKNIEPQSNPLQLEEYQSIQMLESVISLSEAEATENFNNNASSQHNEMTLEEPDSKPIEATNSQPQNQHFIKNPNRGASHNRHIKAKNDAQSDMVDSEEEEREHNNLSKQDSDMSHENFTLAKKEGRPIYAVRADYRACEDTEVDLIANELVIVLEKTGTGWWYVQAASGTGWAPNHFLKVPTELMDANPKVAEEKQLKHLEKLKDRGPAQSTCLAAHKQDQDAPRKTVRHVVKGRPQLFRDGIPATVCPSDFKNETDETSDIGKSVSELRKMFSKWGK